MARPKSVEPTERELEILEVLWRGPATVREVHEALSQTEKVGRTSVLKIMQIMFDKGLVSRDESDFSHRYTAAKSQEEMQTQLVGRFMQRVFGGSASSLMAKALSVKGVSKKDSEKIQQLLEEMEENRDKP
jgi:BlaI family transcriptional regulator, penicillinase repressor